MSLASKKCFMVADDLKISSERRWGVGSLREGGRAERASGTPVFRLGEGGEGVFWVIGLWAPNRWLSRG